MPKSFPSKLISRSDAQAPENSAVEAPAIGEYLADYTEPEPDEWTAADAEVEALFLRSKTVSQTGELR